MFHFIHFFPFPFLMGMAIFGLVAFLLRRRGCAYLIGLALFCAYLLALVAVVFFPIPIPENWPRNLTREGTLQSLQSVNLVPFNYSLMFPYEDGPRTYLRPHALRDIIANIILTIPFGIGFCYLFRPHPVLIVLLAASVGLALEGVQLFLKLALGVYAHAVDITDVIMNGLGVLIGAAVFIVLRAIIRTINKK